VKQSKITKSSRGQECKVRIPGICNHTPETVVAAHLNGGGMGMKSPDYQIADACYACHMALDGHTKTDYTQDELRIMHLEGVIRTQ